MFRRHHLALAFKNPAVRISEALQIAAPMGYITFMTKLLDQAMDAVRVLPPEEQDDIARVILQLAGTEDAIPVELSPEQRMAIDKSKTAAARGEFASDEQVRAVWAKHGL